jgi:hypothetical protein
MPIAVPFLLLLKYKDNPEFREEASEEVLPIRTRHNARERDERKSHFETGVGGVGVTVESDKCV